MNLVVVAPSATPTSILKPNGEACLKGYSSYLGLIVGTVIFHALVL